MRKQSLPFKFYGTNYKVYFKKNTYLNGGGLYLEMINGRYEPFATLTVNLERYPTTAPNRAFVDSNNLPNVEKWIEENHLGKKTNRMGFSGFCVYNEYEFDMNEIEKYLIEDKD